MYYVVKYKHANGPDAVAVVRRKPAKSRAYLVSMSKSKQAACRVAHRAQAPFKTPIPGCTTFR